MGTVTRKIICLNNNWHFNRDDVGPAAALSGTAVNLPHCWNAQDGQDGGNDYYRGTCWYGKELGELSLSDEEEAWLEFRGAAMTATVYLNGRKLTVHEGGYSTFRVNITNALYGKNVLAVSVDNAENDRVYPQRADFTFYGGIYRDVNLVIVPAVHFDLAYFGGPGILVTPIVSEDRKSAQVTVEAWISDDGPTPVNVTFTVAGQTQTVPATAGHAQAVFTIDPVHLWDGVSDPWLYEASAALESGDAVTATFGCRSFSMDPEKGFLLNGRSYRLCGAARHQDRQGVGTAISREMMEEDISIMREMGANTIRLAHYQHDQYFYDLCDRTGMAVWVEIPYITEHMSNGNANTVSQMTELIVQNANHPSIICWGLSNEITAHGGTNPDMIDNHRVLHDLCHRLDSTRPTTMAHAFMLDPDEDFVRLPDICSYNLYYGWYLGELDANDKFFDDYHAAYPDSVIGLSEFGADANPAYQSPNPTRGDWTESYQAVYHEHMLKMWSQRPYIWAMYCWNMFDFGADGREEGGKPGQNQKGLVTFDRKTRKDAFYLYRAYLSDEPFVHLCGRRYVDRPEDVTEIKVYSNQPEVSLFVDGMYLDTQSGDKVFCFEVPIRGTHEIRATAGATGASKDITAFTRITDTMTIRKVDQPNPEYTSAGSAEIVNWFDKPEELIRPGYFSIMDTMADIRKDPDAGALLAYIMEKATESYGDVAKGVSLPPKVQELMDRSPLQATLKQAGKAVSPAMVQQLNAALNQIRKK